MGLIGYFLGPAARGGSCIFLSPTAFLLSPELWFKAVSTYDATYCSAPNFAFQLVTNKVEIISKKVGGICNLKLGQLKGMMNAAEPIQAETLEQFERAYADAGFRPEQWACTYGLAENVIYVSGSSRVPTVLQVDAQLLKVGRVQLSDADLNGSSTTIVGCGFGADGIETIIVDPDTCSRKLPDQVRNKT